MKKEIEKKYKVDSHDSIKLKLEELSFVCEGSGSERDIYFNVSGRDSMTTKECLRIRDYGHRQEITYKGKTEIESGHFAKEEVNLAISDVQNTIKFLLLIGNTLLVDFTKERTTYSFGGVSVLLDTIMSQGVSTNFVEVEVLSENEEEALIQIHEVSKNLLLTDEMIEVRPYRDIAMGL